MNQTIELHIEELILHGFSPHDRYHIGAAVEAELTRLFTEQGIPASLLNGIEIPSINAGTFNYQTNDNRKNTGNSIASSVYKGLAK